MLSSLKNSIRPVKRNKPKPMVRRHYKVPDYFDPDNNTKLTIIGMDTHCKYCLNTKKQLCSKCRGARVITSSLEGDKVCEWCAGTGFVKCYRC